MATIKRCFEVKFAINAGSGGIVSNWAPLKASCKIQLGGWSLNATCPLQSVRSRYRLGCL